jgi:hypothetical protein
MSCAADRDQDVQPRGPVFNGEIRDLFFRRASRTSSSNSSALFRTVHEGLVCRHKGTLPAVSRFPSVPLARCLHEHMPGVKERNRGRASGPDPFWPCGLSKQGAGSTGPSPPRRPCAWHGIFRTSAEVWMNRPISTATATSSAILSMQRQDLITSTTSSPGGRSWA